ncbi:MAG: hypothetical protein N2316_12380 [Spirochaetes bacterium]|nr:hypothetical protein [Spirochaetota bacterium]
MQQIFEAFKSQPFFILVLAFLIALFAYALLKKLIKILAIIALLLVLYGAYLVYRGETIIISKKTLKEYSKKQIETIKHDALNKVTRGINK